MSFQYEREAGVTLSHSVSSEETKTSCSCQMNVQLQAHTISMSLFSSLFPPNRNTFFPVSLLRMLLNSLSSVSLIFLTLKSIYAVAAASSFEPNGIWGSEKTALCYEFCGERWPQEDIVWERVQGGFTSRD